jgi:hypothetical protein
MKIFDVASNLDVAGWLRGLFGAGISGGSAAISSSFGVTLIDPAHWNLQNGKGKLLSLMGITFTINAVVSMSKFLSAQPLPPMKTVTTTLETVMGEKPGPVIINRVEETHSEPVVLPKQ